MVPTADPAVAFADVDAAILVGSMPRREGMERKDLLQANAKIFEVQGKALDQHAKKTVKVSIYHVTLVQYCVVHNVHWNMSKVTFICSHTIWHDVNQYQNLI